MKFKIGQKIKVVDVKYGGNFGIGDIITIKQIGDASGEDMNCYGAYSPYDGGMWYLYEDEVAPITKGDSLRAMTDEELAKELVNFAVGLAKIVTGNESWNPTQEQLNTYYLTMKSQLQEPHEN